MTADNSQYGNQGNKNDQKNEIASPVLKSSPVHDVGGQRLTRANNALIRYPRFRELHREIQRCQETSKLAGEAQCISLEGQPGAGKSTLVCEYAKAFPRIETLEGTEIPVFYMETPSPVTIKGLAAVMLEHLGDPAAHKGTLWSMNSRLVKYIIACKVELVILDDFHHLIDIDTDRILKAVSDWLKVLIKETGVPFLVVGIEEKVENILAANEQLSRLFATRETLHPFIWNIKDQATIQDFGRFIEYAERAVALPIATPFGRVDMLYRIHYATNGVVANIMNLLRYAQSDVLVRQGVHIEMGDLSRAYAKRLQKHLRGRINPFATSTSAFTPPTKIDGDARKDDVQPVPGKQKAKKAL